MDDPSTKEDIDLRGNPWEDYDELSEGRTIAPLEHARVICSYIGWQFSGLPRKTQDNKKILGFDTLAGWIETEISSKICHNDFITTLFYETGFYDANFVLEEVYTRSSSSNDPHLMLMISHGFECSETSLLRGEILPIVALMLTGLDHKSFASDNVIPIIVFSFMGNKKGRILQAHNDKQRLMIWASQLYDFSTKEKAEKPMELFLQYMAGEVRWPKGFKASIPKDIAIPLRGKYE